MPEMEVRSISASKASASCDKSRPRLAAFTFSARTRL